MNWTRVHPSIKRRPITSPSDWQIRQQRIEEIPSLPKILSVHGHHVDVEYVFGVQLPNKRDIDQEKLYAALSKFYTETQQVQVTPEPLDTYIDRKLTRVFASDVLSNNQFQSLERRLSRIPESTPGFIHGDISYHNIIASENNTYQLIDLDCSQDFYVEFDMIKPLEELIKQKNSLMQSVGRAGESLENNYPFWSTLFWTKKIIDRNYPGNTEGLREAIKNTTTYL